MVWGWEQKIESSSMLFTNFVGKGKILQQLLGKLHVSLQNQSMQQVWKNEFDSRTPMELMLTATNLQQVKRC
ncbi:hypothetical protein Hanom_Chr12g01136871 [Helianthus anomalus]